MEQISVSESETVDGIKQDNADRFLKLTVFLCGMSVMGIEMSASRLLAPSFGTSLFIWTNIIGAMMTGLSLGYWFGGRIADRHPRADVFYKIILGAGLLVGAIPFLAQPIMKISTEAIRHGQASIVVGSLLATIGLFVLPITLLGMVSPFAIRLASRGEDVLGATAGSLYALSTVGSLIGTWLPVLLTIPVLGTRRTILSFAAVLVLVGLVGLFRKTAVAAPLVAVGGPLVAALVWTAPFGAMPLTVATGPGAILVEEDESLYHYIQVQQKGSRVMLVLNEGHAVHSIYESNEAAAWSPMVGSVWDSMNALPLLLDKPPGSKLDVLIVGLAAGTVSKQLNHFFGKIYDLHIDGVEIDGRITELGKKYFAMNEPNLTIHVMDGRMFLARSERKWDLIMCDAYRQPYIPFHLATREYFELLKEHLNPDGLMSINVGSLGSDGPVLQRIKSTVLATYGSAEIMRVRNPPGTHFDNFVLIAGRPSLVSERLDPTVPGSLAHQVVTSSKNPFLAELLQRRMKDFSPAQVPAGTMVLEDDRAPVEVLTDWMIARFAARGNAG